MEKLSLNKTMPFKTISVSKAYDIKICPLKAILDKSVSFSIFPPNLQSILGTVIHYTIEKSSLINSQSNFDEIWYGSLNKQLSNYSYLNIDAFELNCKDYHVNKSIIQSKILNKKTTTSKSLSSFSKEQKVSGKYFVGFIDYYKIIENNLIVKDYKTGNFFDFSEGLKIKLKDSYIIQLKIYAGLLLNKYKSIRKLSLFIADVGGNEFEVSSSISEVERILNEYNLLIERINNSISQNKFTRLANKNKNCKFCNARFYCPNFESFLKEGINDGFYDVTGRLISYTTTLRGFNLKIELNDEIMVVYNFSRVNFNVDELQRAINSQVVVFNTIKLKKDNLGFNSTKFSTIFRV